MKMNRMVQKPETESERLPVVVVRATSVSSAQPKLREQKSSISSAKSGVLLTRKASQIDLSETPSQNIFIVERLVRVLRTGDDIIAIYSGLQFADICQN
jgi:hypothetical protein